MRRTVIPYVLLVVALALTAVATGVGVRAGKTSDRHRFETAATRVTAAVERRLDAYITMLLGGAGLFAASEHVQLPEFRAYVERLELPRRYPGIQGIGFSRRVAVEERDRVEKETRVHAPAFSYYPATDGETHAIVYLEPQDEANRVALGYNMYSEPTRRAAMERARDEARPAATRRVRLVQEIDPQHEQAGFLIYVPVYAGGDIPATPAERRARLFGFVYSPFRTNDLLSGIKVESDSPEVDFDVFDAPPDATPKLLHQGPRRSEPPRFETDLELEMAGQRWLLRFRSGPEFAAGPIRRSTLAIALVGLVLSLAVFAVTRAQVQARDAAERTAEELRRSEEALREANRAKDEFLAIVSHELRTPLNAIVGWIAILNRGQVGPEDHARALKVIERNALAQTRLIEDLLDVSRAAAGGLRLDRGAVEVPATLKSAVEAVRPDAERGGVEIACEFAPDLGWIPGDPARLQQVVLNVLANAVKFTPEGGRVLVAAARRDSAVTIRVADTGMGIPTSFLPHVFDRFRQADTSTTRAQGGIGVGLAIARHIVELHGGRIALSSEGEGRGTICTIHLPAEEVAAV